MDNKEKMLFFIITFRENRTKCLQSIYDSIIIRTKFYFEYLYPRCFYEQSFVPSCSGFRQVKSRALHMLLFKGYYCPFTFYPIDNKISSNMDKTLMPRGITCGKCELEK